MQLLLLPIFLALLFAPVGQAAPVPAGVDSAVAVSPNADDFPDASIIVLWDRRVLDVDSAGAGTMWVDQCIKLLDERAKDEQGDRSIRFDAERDTVIFESVRTRLADGTWIEPEPDAYTVTSAPEVQWASAYSQLKQQNVSFPGLAAGAVIYWKYCVAPKPGREPWADDYQGGVLGFGGFEPVKEQRFEIRSEQSLNIQYELQNSDNLPLESVDGTRRSPGLDVQRSRSAHSRTKYGAEFASDPAPRVHIIFGLGRVRPLRRGAVLAIGGIGEYGLDTVSSVGRAAWPGCASFGAKYRVLGAAEHSQRAVVFGCSRL
ncbi:MAG: DUF3857 domain-containing protein [bacterium]|nr:DUF3857 domain-containing protein [bacterium]